MNDDPFVDGDEIELSVLGLTDPEAYPGPLTMEEFRCRGDINNDTYFDGDDIAGFVALLLGGGPATAVPEPSSFVLLAVGVLGFVLMRSRKSVKSMNVRRV